MSFCLTCDAEKHPVQAFTAKGFVDACPTCQGVFARHDEPLQAEPPEPPAAPLFAAPTAAPARPVVKPSGEPTAWGNILDQARARLVFCEEQIAARDGFISERDMLKKMLAAAEGETKPAEREALPLTN